MVKILKFSAVWCGPCKLFAKTFHDLQEEEEFKDDIFLEIDVDNDEDELSVRYGVRSVPTTIVVDPDNGDLLGRMVGNVDKKTAKETLLGFKK